MKLRNDENEELNENGLTDEEETRRRSLEEDGCCSVYYEKPSLYPEEDYSENCDGFDDEDFFEDED